MDKSSKTSHYPSMEQNDLTNKRCGVLLVLLLPIIHNTPAERVLRWIKESGPSRLILPIKVLELKWTSGRLGQRTNARMLGQLMLNWAGCHTVLPVTRFFIYQLSLGSFHSFSFSYYLFIFPARSTFPIIIRVSSSSSILV